MAAFPTTVTRDDLAEDLHAQAQRLTNPYAQAQQDAAGFDAFHQALASIQARGNPYEADAGYTPAPDRQPYQFTPSEPAPEAAPAPQPPPQPEPPQQTPDEQGFRALVTRLKDQAAGAVTGAVRNLTALPAAPEAQRTPEPPSTQLELPSNQLDTGEGRGPIEDVAGAARAFAGPPTNPAAAEVAARLPEQPVQNVEQAAPVGQALRAGRDVVATSPPVQGLGRAGEDWRQKNIDLTEQMLLAAGADPATSRDKATKIYDESQMLAIGAEAAGPQLVTEAETAARLARAAGPSLVQRVRALPGALERVGQQMPEGRVGVISPNAGAIERAGVQKFGTTADTREAGYILRDGTALDFSGKQAGGEPGVRYMDHSEIGRIMPPATEAADYRSSVSRFTEATGAVRFSDAGGTLVVDIPGGLSPQQRGYLQSAGRYSEGAVVEVFNPATRETINYAEFDFPRDRGKYNRLLQGIPEHEQPPPAAPAPGAAGIVQGSTPPAAVDTSLSGLAHGAAGFPEVTAADVTRGRLGALAGGAYGGLSGPADQPPEERARRAITGAVLGGTGALAAGPAARSLAREGPALLRELGTSGVATGPRPVMPSAREEARRRIAAGVAAAPGQGVAEASTAGYVANIRLSKFAPELRPILHGAVDRLSPEAIDAARRGVIPQEVTRRLAAEVGLTTEQFIRRARPGKAYNAEELLAMDTAMASTAREIKDLGGRMAADPTQVTDAMRAEFAALSMQAAGLARTATGARAEAGRALSAMRYLREASSTPTRLRRALSLIGEAANDPNAVAKIAAAADDPVELFGLIRKLQEPNAWQVLNTYYRANLLSAPLTQIRNIVGNVGALAFILPERVTAAGIDAVRAAATGTPRERLFRDVASETEGWGAGFLVGMRKAGDVLTRGYSAEEAQALEQAGKYAPLANARIPFTQQRLGRVGTAMELPFRALGATDAFFRSLAEYGELFTQAYRQAAREGLQGNALRARALAIVDQPPVALMEQVKAAGEYRTYQSTLDSLGNWFKAGSRIPGLNFVMPFVATPYNIAKYELERSPLGVAGVVKGLATKESSGEVADRAARWLLGTGVTAAFFGYALGGDMTAAAPQDAAERDLFYREGKQPYSVRIGNNWYSYSQLTGLSTAMALAASSAEAYRRTGRLQDVTYADWVKAAWQAGQVLTDKPMLQGLANIQDAIASPDKAEQILGGVARGLVPASSLLAMGARATDPYQRETQNLGQRLQAGIPLASRALPARIDAFGEPVARTQTGVEAALNPIARGTASDNPLDAELRRLVEATGQQPGPRPIARKAAIEGVPLTNEQRRSYQQLSGAEAEIALARLFASGEYLRARSDEERVRLVQRELSKGRERAGEIIVPRALRRQAAAAGARR